MRYGFSRGFAYGMGGACGGGLRVDGEAWPELLRYLVHKR